MALNCDIFILTYSFSKPGIKSEMMVCGVAVLQWKLTALSICWM